MIAGQRVIPSRARRDTMRSLRASSNAAWDRGRDDRNAGRAAANPYPAGSQNAETYDDAYRLTKPRTRPALPARHVPGARRQSLAALAGTLCNLREFQLWLGADTAADAAVILRARCGIQSRRELDTNPTAARLFHERVRGPFAASRES